jgi:hypothetical protein
MMARSANAPLAGRIQKRKTNDLQIITSDLQRTAGPYRCARNGLMHCSKPHALVALLLLDHLVVTARAPAIRGTDITEYWIGITTVSST